MYSVFIVLEMLFSEQGLRFTVRTNLGHEQGFVNSAVTLYFTPYYIHAKLIIKLKFTTQF